MKLARIAILATFAFCANALAQGYPNQAVTLVVPFAAGGPNAVLARTLGASMGRTRGQGILVENKVGAGGTIATSRVAKSSPDGYTLFIHPEAKQSPAGTALLARLGDRQMGRGDPKGRPLRRLSCPKENAAPERAARPEASFYREITGRRDGRAPCRTAAGPRWRRSRKR